MPLSPEKYAPVVHIIDDEIELTEALAKVLRALGLTVKIYENGKEFFDTYQPSPIGCLVTDIRMPGMSGTELIERLRSRGDTLPIIVISGCADVATAVRAMKLGAKDLIEKGGSTHYLVEAIQRAIAADTEAAQARALKEETLRCYRSLSVREREVLHGLIAGRTNKQIAEALSISPSTVEVHRANVMTKMGAETLAQLIKTALISEIDTTTTPAA